MSSEAKKVLAALGIIVALVGAAVVVAKAIDADVITAVKVVGYSIIALGILLFIINLMKQRKRRQE